MERRSNAVVQQVTMKAHQAELDSISSYNQEWIKLRESMENNHKQLEIVNSTVIKNNKILTAKLKRAG